MSSALHPRRLSYWLVAALLVSGTVAGTVSTASVTGSTATVTASAASTPNFDDGIVHEQRGDIASIPISLADAGTATVRLKADDAASNYSATFAVEDDGDGRATVRLNTFDGRYAASGNDSVAVRAESNSSVPLAVGDYELWVCAGDDAECDGSDAADVSVLVVAQRSTDGLRTWVAPASAPLSNLSDVNAAMDAGNLTRSETVTRNDTLVLELRASGLDGAIAARNGSNVTARFFAFLSGGAVSLRVEQTNPGTEVRPGRIHLAPNATRVVADSVNDSYYLVTDLSEGHVTGGYGDGEVTEGDEYRANVTLSGSSALAADGRESVVTNFSVVDSREESTTVETTTASGTTTTTATTESPMRGDIETTATRTATTTTEDGTARTHADGPNADIPGFGVVAALIALLAFALVTKRP